MQGHPTGFWGKLEQSADKQVESWHPLVDHSADVGACCQALLERTLLRRRLARLADLSDLDEVQVARLSSLATLHDIGKFNIGFQNKARQGEFTAGHVAEVLALFADRPRTESDQLANALPLADLRSWGTDADGVLQLLVASISHHGRPTNLDGSHQPRCWREANGLNPFDGISQLCDLVRKWFPLAFGNGTALPTNAPFQHAWSGLVTLADWIGSDTRLFPYSEDENDRFHFARRKALAAVNAFGLDAEPSRLALRSPRPSFSDISAHSHPRPAQEATADLPLATEGSVVLLEADTGSGKTEAALLRFAQLFGAGAVDGMYFALPTRTAATQIHARVRDAVGRLFPDNDRRPAVVLAVPGYLRVDDRTGQRLPGFEVLWNDDPTARYRYRAWAAEMPKRYLAGVVVVGTIDQVLLSTLMVGHSHLRATSLLRSFLVVDEIHASDAYMTAILIEVLRNHQAAGGHTMLMSATLGSSARDRLLTAIWAQVRRTTLADAIATPYPQLTQFDAAGTPSSPKLHGDDRTKRVTTRFESCADDPAEVARIALSAAHAGARVAVLRNTVSSCIAVQTQIERLASASDASVLFRCRGVVAPHHGRFAAEDRQRLDRALEKELRTDRTTGLVVVATQTIEQSLDIDLDLLITDLAPMDVLLQRVGRLHRHDRTRPKGFDDPVVVLLTPTDHDLAQYVRADGQARGPNGLGTVYEDLRVIAATWKQLIDNPILSLPADNRRLVENATHETALADIVGDDPAWQRHDRFVRGLWSSQRRLANLNVVDRTVTFGDAQFESRLERRIATRLGEDDRLVTFDPGILSAFSATIHALRLPAHLTPGIPSDTVPSQVTSSDGTLAFAFGERWFRYDRFGLRLHDSVQEVSA